MKNFKYMFLLLIVIMFGCKKDKVDQLKDNNKISAIIVDNFNLSIYSTALIRTGLAKQVDQEGPFTAIAPSDDAFGEIKSANGGKLFVTHWVKGPDTVLTINGSKILSKNVKASNGLIQVIDRVLEPYTYNYVTEAIASNRKLTLFYQALQRAGLIEILNGKGPYTIFAPDNAAMTAFGLNSVESINQMDPAVLLRLMRYHIIADRRFVYDYILSTGISGKSETFGNGKYKHGTVGRARSAHRKWCGTYHYQHVENYTVVKILEMMLKNILHNLFLFLVLLLPVAGMAQETSGTLNGTVLDAAGQPLPGASVIAVHQPSGTRYATSADGKGRYYLPNLRIGGPYSVEAAMISMNSEKKEGITIRLGASIVLNFALKDQAQQLSEVSIKATKPGARASTFGSGKNISADQVKNMATVFGGTNFRYNNVTIDGAINNDAIGFSPSLGGQSGTSGMAGSSTRTNPISLD
eukprot:gene20616-24497_t